jgi:hypothetical protein
MSIWTNSDFLWFLFFSIVVVCITICSVVATLSRWSSRPIKKKENKDTIKDLK